MEFLEISASSEPCGYADPVRDASACEPASVAVELALAQRAFSAMIDAAARPAGVSSAFADPLLLEAQRTLSALSADDRPRLQRWLSLQCATDSRDIVVACMRRADRELAMLIEAVSGATRDPLSAMPRLAA